VALSHLCEHLGVPLSRTIAVGDQENDLEMIEAAGLGVAMPEAPARVRAAAGRVAPTTRDGGLLALFRELMPERFA
jgi:hydroxymethylpyrimidine pyrophosphatase-like HAD family hydrolase